MHWASEKVMVVALVLFATSLLVSQLSVFTPTAKAVNTCTETDRGLDIEVKGTTYLGSRGVEDRCVDSQTLEEGFCQLDSVVVVRVHCACSEGACHT